MKNKSTFTLLFLSLFICNLTNAQMKREVLEEDPNRAPNLRLELTPLIIPSYESAIAQSSIRAVYRLNNKIGISGEYKRDLYGPHEASEQYKAEGGFGSGYEGHLTWFFKKKETEINAYLPVKKKWAGHKTMEVELDAIETTFMTLYGLRGGYGGSTKYKDAHYVTLQGSNPSDIKESILVTPKVKSSYLFAGLNATKIKNIKVRYPGLGVRRQQYIKEFYFDALYNNIPTYSNFNYNDGNGNAGTYSIETSSFTHSKTNLRMGVFSSTTGKWINLGYGVEAGTALGKGTFEDRMYLSLRLTLSLFSKVGMGE